MAEGSLQSQNQDRLDLEKPLLHCDSSSNSKAKGRLSDTVTPHADASFFPTLLFSWITPLFRLGVEKTTLNLEDIPQLGSVNSVFGVFPLLQKRLLELSPVDDNGSIVYNGSKVVPTTKLGLAKALFLLAWKEILCTIFMAVIYTLAQYVGPYLVDSFVECLDGRGEFKDQGYTLILIFSVATLLQVRIQNHYNFKLQQIGIRLRGAVTVMIYYKCLSLSSESSKQQQGGEAISSKGEMINVVACDVETINNFVICMHDSWLIILQIVLALLILYKNLGLFASVVAFAVTGSFTLLNSLFATWQERFQTKLMESKDDRMRVTMETIRNMRVLKLQGWEMTFLSRILLLRKVEMLWFKKVLYNSTALRFITMVSAIVVALATFGSCILRGIPLEAGNILSAIATFRLLDQPVHLLPDTIYNLIQFRVSLGRIAYFLSLDELQPDVSEKLPFGYSDMVIEIIDGNFGWGSSFPPIVALKEINLKVNHGTRVAICGGVGSGKSSLLSAILGEISKISGTVKLCGTMAYVAQSPWIHSGTIQENILFGQEMDHERYDKVLRACCLKKDLEILLFGDQTVIGERGVNLSGGQKQRIQIARALYHEADIYLFDDPFSAVDAHTSSHLFEEVLLGLLSTKTVVYVTHQVEFLNAADQIVVMRDGKIAQMGNYNDILIPGSHFQELVSAQMVAISAIRSNFAAPSSVENESPNVIVQVEEGNKALQNCETNNDGSVVALPQEAQLIDDEERETGRVGLSVYWKYITAAYGGLLVALILLGHIVWEILQICSNYWLAWATPVSKDVKPTIDGSTLIAVYVSLAAGASFVTLAITILLVIVTYKTATILFEKMLRRIFLASMSFFDATPSGRILNRLSKDQNALETRIPILLLGLVACAIGLLGIMAVMTMVAWPVLLIFIPVIFASIWYQQYYMPLSRELSRLSGACQAPVIQYFAETMSGIATIRSFDQESKFQATYMKLVDAYSRPEFHVAAALRWLLLRLDVFACITFSFLLVLSVYFAKRIDPAIAGLAVTYGLTLNNELVSFVRCLCTSETKMISVERILQYISIPGEAPLVIEANRPDCCWPSNGEIDIHNLQVQYAPHLPLVLHNVTCKFPGGMKTGIVGRTGSGKSTLIQALFRIVEPTGGRIVIDGIDISTIGLQDLRSRLSIIPQEPIMFQGTIRSNLDPLEQYTDQQIWEVVDKCQLGDEVRKMDKKLDSYVNENGENWSMGQRQLICLGRVLLKRSKVLVLDEATASVDTATDNLIQQTLKLHFSHCTLVTIAHRISSVFDSDLVLVLNQGYVEEFESPRKLLQNKSSSFAQLVAEYMARSSNSDAQ